MDKTEKFQIMSDTAQQLVSMIQARTKNRLNALNSLSMTPMDLSSVPDEVKMMREIESAKLRAVMQEQADLIEIINMLYPKLKPLPVKPKIKKRVIQKRNPNA